MRAGEIVSESALTVGLWCRKGHLIEPDDDQGQCEAIGVVYVVQAECEWTDAGWKVKP